MNRPQPVTVASAAALLAGVACLSLCLALPCLWALSSPWLPAAPIQPGGAAEGKVAEQSVEIDCEDLILAYGENPVDGDNKYKGKLLKVTGTLLATVRENNQTYLFLKGPGVSHAQAYFSQPQHLGSYQPKDRVTFLGRVRSWDKIKLTLESCVSIPKQP